ncbi:hypothetical protein L7F22_069066 [Adiantum nelumboides]|nr:hypothetical protein [Adiantum nelumboides]
MPESRNAAKKTLATLGLDYESIHACPNDHVLFRKELAKEVHCPQCHASRFREDVQGNKVPAKVFYYPMHGDTNWKYVIDVAPRATRVLQSTQELSTIDDVNRILDDNDDDTSEEGGSFSEAKLEYSSTSTDGSASEPENRMEASNVPISSNQGAQVFTLDALGMSSQAKSIAPRIKVDKTFELTKGDGVRWFVDTYDMDANYKGDIHLYLSQGDMKYGDMGIVVSVKDDVDATAMPCFAYEESKIEDKGDMSQATQQVLPTIDEETPFHKGDAMSTQEVVEHESDFVAQKPSNDMNKGSENMLPTIGETQIHEGNTRNSEEEMVVVENQSDVQTFPKPSNDMIIKDTYSMPLRDEEVEGSEKKDEANEDHQGALETTEVQDKVDKGTGEATRNANKAQSIQGRVQGTEDLSGTVEYLKKSKREEHTAEQQAAQLAREKIKEALSRKAEEPVLEPTQRSPKRPRQEEEEDIEHIQADPIPPSPINIPPAPPSSPITPFPPASTSQTPPSPSPLDIPKSPPAPISLQQQPFSIESIEIHTSLPEETAQPMDKIEEKQTDGEQHQPTDVDVPILIIQEDEPTNKEAVEEVKSFDYKKLIQTLSRQFQCQQVVAKETDI